MRFCSAWVSYALCWLVLGCRVVIHRSWLQYPRFHTPYVIIVYVMLDVEYPRAGLIRLNPPTSCWSISASI